MGIYQLLSLIVSVLSMLIAFWSVYQMIKQRKNVSKQIDLAKEQMKNDYDEHRRKNTTEYMLVWCSLSKETRLAERLARDLNSTSSKKLYNCNKFGVSEEIAKGLCNLCSSRNTAKGCNNCSCSPTVNGGKYTVDGNILIEFRWHVIHYLNTLETILTAWHLGIVDKETIEKEFDFLHDNNNKSSSLKMIRDSGATFPAIAEFINETNPDIQKSRNPL